MVLLARSNFFLFFILKGLLWAILCLNCSSAARTVYSFTYNAALSDVKHFGLYVATVPRLSPLTPVQQPLHSRLELQLPPLKDEDRREAKTNAAE